MKALRSFLDGLGDPVLLVHDDASAEAAATLADVATLHRLGGALPDSQRWAAVAVLVHDRLALRESVAGLPHLGRARAVACVLVGDAAPLAVAPRPDWPTVTQLAARTLPSGSSLTTLRASGPLPVHAVLAELARAAGTAPSDSGRVAIESPGHRRRVTLPPDVVVRADDTTPVQEYDATVAPPPPVVTDTWLARGPVDEGLLHPVGFDPAVITDASVLTEPLRVDPALAADLRTHRTVTVDWSVPSPALARSVAALAMAGTPLVGGPPPEARPWLGDPLADVLAHPVEADDPLRREEHSVRVRRAALLTHSGPGWRHRVAEAAGRPTTRFPRVGVVLATRRADLLGHALGQVSRQHGVDVELVVAAHGFSPDVAELRALAPGVDLEVVSLPEETLFGDVLDAGVAAGSAPVVVKMDDDDHYGPHFLLDLLLAREYSGADVVGAAAEYVHLEGRNLTVRRSGTPRDASERFAQIVAGGTITIGRDLLTSVGGFAPVRRFVDHQLFHAVRAAGGTIYRAHGLGFVLRRTSSGHTWTVEDEHFLDPERLHQQWEGFAPSRILDDTETA